MAKRLKNKYILSIDPAGVGSTGVILYDTETAKIVAKITYRSDNDDEAVSKLEIALEKFKKMFLLQSPICIIENFFLSPKRLIKNPLSTPMAIGGAKFLIKKVFKNPLLILQEPKNKSDYRYSGNVKMSTHEHDAWRHVQYFLEQQKRSDKICQ